MPASSPASASRGQALADPGAVLAVLPGAGGFRTAGLAARRRCNRRPRGLAADAAKSDTVTDLDGRRSARRPRPGCGGTVRRIGPASAARSFSPEANRHALPGRARPAVRRGTGRTASLRGMAPIGARSRPAPLPIRPARGSGRARQAAKSPLIRARGAKPFPPVRAGGPIFGVLRIFSGAPDCRPPAKGAASPRPPAGGP